MKIKDEELKTTLDGISNMLEEIITKLRTNAQEENTTQIALLKDQVDNLDKEMKEVKVVETNEQFESLKEDINKLETAFKNCFPSDLLDAIGNSLEKLNKTIEEPQTTITKHQHTIDIKSSKPLFIWIGLFFLLIGSLILNTSQYSKNQKLKDNDLKYRSILMVGSINGKDLNNLQEVFHRRRNKKQIEKIRIMVEDFEYKCKQEAEFQERMRLIDDK